MRSIVFRISVHDAYDSKLEYEINNRDANSFLIKKLNVILRLSEILIFINLMNYADDQ